MIVIDGKEFVAPILHEDVSFAYYDEHRDVVGAIGYADYYEDFTVITHTGSETVAFDLLHLPITHLKFGGVFELAKRIAPTEGGLPRFIIRRGYEYFYPKEETEEIKGEIGGVDAWTALHPDRQLHLSECEYARDRAPRISDLREEYRRFNR